MGNCQTTKTHKVVVTTGDKKSGGATDINVHLTLTDVKDSVSNEIKLTSVWNNDFRKGQQEQFNLDLPGLTKIKEISVRRDEVGAKDDWFVDRVEITCITDNSKPSIFPFHRWIHADTKLSLVEFDTTLPQFEKHPEQREKELKQKREKYILVSKILGAPRQVEILPEDEQFSYAYEFDIAKEYASQLIKTTLIDWTTPEFDSLQDMKDIFKKCNIKVPSGIKEWRLDESFGNQKLCGCNPGIIQLCTQIPDYFAVTADLVEPFLEGKTLQTALSQKRLYMIDLRYLSEVECPRSCVLPGPTCLLYVKDSKDLVPVAIQLMPKPGSDNPVFTPADPEYTWMAAKMWFNFAETADHESASHLGHTHLLIESVAVCTHRELSPSHPMFRLLAPHFLYVMPINDGAIRSLVSTDGWIEKTMSIGRVGMFNIIRLKWAEWNLQEDGNFVKNLKRRGVDDVSALPNYHYRDDGLLIWRAIENYVRKVVNTVYDQPQKLSADTEIEAWREALIKDAEFKIFTYSLHAYSLTRNSGQVQHE
ncbi:ALOX5 [Bugula neritina]|uniref:ALOX5 n=1 Tax=Bugula neritina TaxID=10212 RepID=A0A7J7J7C0_BUGNE|nr:ALOX5 [Bugula neritina]